MKDYLEGKIEKHMMDEDTIAAVSTAFGEGGIGIVRVSGPAALSVLEKLFRPGAKANAASRDLSEPDPLSGLEPRRLTYGHIVNPEDGRPVDEVLAVYMQAPHTYTCEDVVEIHCHGSIMSLRTILALTLAHGARAAEQGEFTKRAFLNGRLDLSQAEAVMDLIGAKTDDSRQAAMDQLDGRLSQAVSNLRGLLMDVLVDLGVNMDYPDEDIEPVVYEKLLGDLTETRQQVQALKDSAGSGKVLREGIKAAILGRPNVGKSSLLNAMMGTDRAIVTDIPGTTRDVISEYIDIKGIPVELVDTAGIREADDTIERIGIERSRESAAAADLVLLVIDGSEALAEEDRRLLEEMAGMGPGKKVLVVLNKQDLGQTVDEAQVKGYLPEASVVVTSFAAGALDNATPVTDAIYDLVMAGQVVQGQSALVTNVRHEEALARALTSLDDALEATARDESLELIEIDVRGAYEALGEILGETLGDDIIEEIFARFCLGK